MVKACGAAFVIAAFKHGILEERGIMVLEKTLNSVAWAPVHSQAELAISCTAIG